MPKFSAWLLLMVLIGAYHPVMAQEIVTPKYPVARHMKPSEQDSILAAGQTDVSDLYHLVFHQKKRSPKSRKSGSLVLLPSIGYTPSTGFEFGADVSGSKYLGDPENTTLSVFDAYAVISTNELALLQLTHNIYTNHNKWNVQGSYDLGKTVILDHGLGTGKQQQARQEIRYKFLKLNENVYRSIFPNFYAGAGLAFNYYGGIDEEMSATDVQQTHNFLYSTRNGYDAKRYFANGLLLNLQYNTRDQPYRPYKGIYVDVILRANQKWLGSEKYALQLKTELRKYWSLSSRQPEHVLAFWLWGSYLMHGTVPYLDLPGTGSDVNQRLGRGYTIGRFKGPSFYYNEAEYRFPITKDNLLSGVAFLNVQTAGNQADVKLFNHWEPGAGAGIRILFDKHTRSNLCVDYGIGNYGSRGVFVGLNEVF